MLMKTVLAAEGFFSAVILVNKKAATPFTLHSESGPAPYSRWQSRICIGNIEVSTFVTEIEMHTFLTEIVLSSVKIILSI